MTTRDCLEIACKFLVGAVFVYAGITLIERFQLGVIGQITFWPVFLVLAYWLVIREIYIPWKAKDAPIVGCVVVDFPLRNGDHGSHEERAEIHRFADVLDSIARESNVGEYDGDEFGAGRCKLFFYTDEPEKLFRRIEQELRSSGYIEGMTAKLTRPGQSKPFRQIDF